MDVAQREPCASCAEPVALEARVCPYCGRGALVDVRLEQAVEDPRLRYQAARLLNDTGPAFAGASRLQEAMAAPRPLIARAVTRAQAARAREALQPLGLEVVSTPAAARPARRAQAVAATAALAAGAATLAALVATRSGPGHGPPPAPTPAATLAPAGVAAVPTAPPTEVSRNELARMALASTAALHCGSPAGAGFFVADGLLLTNAHVLCRDGARLRVILADGRETAGTLVRSDEDLDLALVHASGLGAPPLPLGDAAAVSVGDRILLVGSPVGMDFTVHEGMVSATGRVILGTAYIQLDAKVNPGNSGGPLLDATGRVVGVVSLKRKDAEGIALALPINYAYSGHEPLVPAPPGDTSTAFEAMLARARQEDEAQAGALAAAGSRPLLAGVYVGGQRQVLARILRPSRHQPSYEEFAFKVWSGRTEVCAMTTSVGEWRPVDVPEATAGSDARVRAWLEKHGLPVQLYQGEAPLRLDLCAREHLRPGVQLELQGAEPSASRVALY